MRIIVDEKYVTFKKGNFVYDIPFSRLKSPIQLLDWTCHLSEKNWVDADLLGRFIETVATFKGWEVRGAA